MVVWAANGSTSGYNAAQRKLTPAVYFLASPGTVDVNGITRINYTLDPSLPEATYPNDVEIRIPLTFTSADIAANPGRAVSAGVYACAADWFEPGYVPTPAEIIALGDEKLTTVWGDYYWTSIPSSVTRTYTLGLDFTGLQGAKVWVLAIPVSVGDVKGPATYPNMRPLTGIAVNTMGRAISLWGSRTPAAPVITSPATGSIVQPGEVTQFKFAVNDPDSTFPDDPDRFNLDLAGVEVEYARIPTPENPDPLWRHLTYIDAGGVTRYTSRVRGEVYNGYSTPAGVEIITNLGFPIACGTDEAPPYHALLPGGDWQLRCRTADFGNPYPQLANPLDGKARGWGMSNYPALNTSPWSEPVRISIPSQTPPPIPLSPSSSIAVQEGQTTRLLWQYRNTHLPPYDQRDRYVQIRKVGGAAWSQVFAGPGDRPYVDLPPTIDNPTPVAPIQYISDPGFESGTLGGWTDYPVGSEVPASTRVNTAGAPPASHSGSRHLAVSFADDGGGFGIGYASMYQEIPVDPSHGVFEFSGWVAVTDDVAGVSGSLLWKDVNGELIEAQPDEIGIFSFFKPDAGWGGATWLNFQTGWEQEDPDDYTSPIIPAPTRKPANAVTAVISFAAIGVAPFGPPMRVDDLSFTGYDPYPTDDFTLEATTWYEWRVKVTDEDGVTSTFSEPARFWVVPAGGSGEVRPVPSETIDGATLGCGTNRVFVYRRGGQERVGELRGLSHVDWGRVRDDISTAKVVVKDWDVDCGELLKRLQTWAYEIVVFRDNGFSVDRVWEGPITLLTYEVDSVTIQAKDVVGYAYRRILRQQMNDSGNSATAGDTVTSRGARVLRNAFAPDDPNVLAYMQVLSREDDAKQYRSTPAYARTAFEEVDDMAANAGLDYTAVGRAILLWGTKHRIGTLPEFRDNDLGAPPIVSEYGMSMANIYSVSDGNGVHGEATRLDASGNDPIYGIVEMLSSTWASDSESVSGTYTEEGLATVVESFKEFAERSINDRYPPPVVVRVPDNTTLNPDAPISIQQLVPGVAIPLRSTGTLRSVYGTQKLDSVSVVEEAGKETITITLSPFSRDDVVAGGETEGDV